MKQFEHPNNLEFHAPLFLQWALSNIRYRHKPAEVSWRPCRHKCAGRPDVSKGITGPPHFGNTGFFRNSSAPRRCVANITLETDRKLVVNSFLALRVCKELMSESGATDFGFAHYMGHGIFTVAHCAAPMKMNGKGYEPAKIMTHFESDYGAATKVRYTKGKCVTVITSVRSAMH